MRTYDVTELIDFKEQPDGSVTIEPKRIPFPHGRWVAHLHREQRPGECVCGAGFAPYCCAYCWPQ